MTTLSDFCARVGIDREAVGQAIARQAPQDEAPWYMQAVLGVGAWITAIAALFFAAVVMDLVFDIDEPDVAVAAAGAIVFAGSIWALQRRPEGAFSAHAAVAFATAGTLLAAAGIGFPGDSLWLAAAATLPFAAVAIWQQKSVLLQFLLVSGTLILAILAIWEDWEQVAADIPAIFVPIGAALLLHPPRRDPRPTAFALLVVPLLATTVASDFAAAGELFYGWPAKAVLIVVFGALVALHWRQATDRRAKELALAGAIAAVAVTILLPTGAAASLVILALAYMLGSRTLAVIGTVAEAYFIWQFYADLQATLLAKSIILMSAGGILLVYYGLLVRARRHA